MSFRISLNALRLPVSIGWEAEERRTLQTIRFDLEITLAAEPSAGRSDELGHTVDYGVLAEVIRSVATRESYRLLERLASVVRDEVRLRIPATARLELRVTKERPPIAGLEGGASVTISE